MQLLNYNGNSKPDSSHKGSIHDCLLVWKRYFDHTLFVGY